MGIFDWQTPGLSPKELLRVQYTLSHYLQLNLTGETKKGIKNKFMKRAELQARF